MTFKDTLMEVVKKNNGSRKDTARLLGIAEGYFSQLLGGTRKPSAKLHQRIIEAYHGRLALPEEMRPDQGNIRRVPIVSYAQAGTVASDYQDLCNQIDEMVETDCKGENTFAVRVVGDSMESEAFDGDIAIINPNTEAQSGRPALVRLKDGGATMIKWFFRSGEKGDRIILGSENQAHETKVVRAEDLEWAYLVHAIRRQPRTRRVQDFLSRTKTPEPPASNTQTRRGNSAQSK